MSKNFSNGSKLIILLRFLTWFPRSSKIIENRGKINFPGKSWKIDKNLKVMEKLKYHEKFWTDENGTKFKKFFSVSKR